MCTVKCNYELKERFLDLIEKQEVIPDFKVNVSDNIFTKCCSNCHGQTAMHPNPKKLYIF